MKNFNEWLFETTTRPNTVDTINDENLAYLNEIKSFVENLKSQLPRRSKVCTNESYIYKPKLFSSEKEILLYECWISFYGKYTYKDIKLYLNFRLRHKEVALTEAVRHYTDVKNYTMENYPEVVKDLLSTKSINIDLSKIKLTKPTARRYGV